MRFSAFFPYAKAILFSLFALGILPISPVISTGYGEIGTQGSNGEIPYIEAGVDRGEGAIRFYVRDVSSLAKGIYLCTSWAEGHRDMSKRYGSGAVLCLDTSREAGFKIWNIPSQSLTLDIFDKLQNNYLYLQAFVLDPGAVGGVCFSEPLAFLLDPEYKVQSLLKFQKALYQPAAVVNPENGKVFVFGGITSDFSNDIFSIRADNPLPDVVSLLDDTLPSGKTGLSAVWDKDAKKAYIFGGYGNGGYTSEILSFDPAKSKGHRVASTLDELPSRRGYTSALMDSARGIAYIFGGSDSRPLAEILVFDPSQPEGSRISYINDTLPSPVVSPASVWDDREEVAYIFAGNSIIRFDPSQTEGSRVFLLADSLPSSRTLYSATFDSERGVAYLFGGVQNPFTSEIVEFDPKKPSGQRVRIVNNLPTARGRTASIYDPVRKYSLILGGLEFGRILNEIVLYRGGNDGGSAVTLGSLPQKTKSMASVIDPRSGKAYIFGGIHTEFSKEIICFSLNAPLDELVETLPYDELPSGRSAVSAVWDDERNVAYIFGGFRGQYLSEIIEFNPSRQPGYRVSVLSDYLPTARGYTAAAWDPIGNKAYILGGNGPRSLRDICMFDPSASSGHRVTLLSDTLPDKSYSGAAVWDTRIEKIVFYYGRDVIFLDPSANSGNKVTLTSDKMPSTRLNLAAVYFPVKGKTFLFGGGLGTYLDEILAFDSILAEGTRVREAGELPYGLEEMTGVYDKHSGYILLFGGMSSKITSDILMFSHE